MDAVDAVDLVVQVQEAAKEVHHEPEAKVVKLPQNAKVLSKSADCPVAMFSLGENFLGIQGHPEFSKEYNRAVFESRIEKIGQEKIDRAILTFTAEPDRDLLRGFLSRFLSG